MYTDMVVGAYSDNTAVLFYSNPPVSLKVDVKFVNIANNIISKDTKTFGFQVCLSYSGDNLPQDIGKLVGMVPTATLCIVSSSFLF